MGRETGCALSEEMGSEETGMKRKQYCGKKKSDFCSVEVDPCPQDEGADCTRAGALTLNKAWHQYWPPPGTVSHQRHTLHLSVIPSSKSCITKSSGSKGRLPVGGGVGRSCFGGSEVMER